MIWPGSPADEQTGRTTPSAVKRGLGPVVVRARVVIRVRRRGWCRWRRRGGRERLGQRDLILELRRAGRRFLGPAAGRLRGGRAVRSGPGLGLVVGGGPPGVRRQELTGPAEPPGAARVAILRRAGLCGL